MPEADDDTLHRLRRHAVDLLHVHADQVTLDARFDDDLDADSIDLVELMMSLEDELGISIDESELEGIETVDQAIRLVRSKR